MCMVVLVVCVGVLVFDCVDVLLDDVCIVCVVVGGVVCGVEGVVLVCWLFECGIDVVIEYLLLFDEWVGVLCIVLC